MTLLGEAAMVLWYDITPDAIAEHDDWHTHEHLPERVSIPGFVRALRWVIADSTAPEGWRALLWTDLGSPLLGLPYVFCLLNWATVVAFWRFIRRKQSVTWERGLVSDGSR